MWCLGMGDKPSSCELAFSQHGGQTPRGSVAPRMSWEQAVRRNRGRCGAFSAESHSLPSVVWYWSILSVGGVSDISGTLFKTAIHSIPIITMTTAYLKFSFLLDWALRLQNLLYSLLYPWDDIIWYMVWVHKILVEKMNTLFLKCILLTSVFFSYCQSS